MSSLRIRIADLNIAVEGDGCMPELGIEQRLGPFFASFDDDPPSILIRWKSCEVALPPGSELIYAPGDIWCMYRSAGRHPYRALIRYSSADGGFAGEALIEASPEWDDLLLTEKTQGDGWCSLLSAGAGELIVRARLALSHGLVFHACGIDVNGSVLLFAGHSGAGKSTQAALWAETPGIVIMNDDRMAVRIYNGAAQCYGLPWGGTLEIAKNHKSPLGRILLLEQSARSSIRELSFTESFARLAPCAFLPYWEPGLLSPALDTLCEILQRVPVYLLKCRADADAVSLVRSVP